MWTEARARGLDRISGKKGAGASSEAIEFFRTHDLGFRIRRLRFLARELDASVEAKREKRDPVCEDMRETIFAALGQYLPRAGDACLPDLAAPAHTPPGQWIPPTAAPPHLVAPHTQPHIP